MVWEWIRFITAAGLLLLGMFFEILAVFGVQKFRKALNRMHAAAIGDTLGVLFIFLGLMVMRGFTMDSLKLFLVILFFWMASPVSGHMISRLEAMTNQNLGEIHVIHMGEAAGPGAERDTAAGEGAGMQPGPEGKPVVNAETQSRAEGKPAANAETQPCAEGLSAANAETQSCAERRSDMGTQSAGQKEIPPEISARSGKGDVR